MQKFRILFEDDCLVAIDKPAGFHSHPPEDKAIRISHRWNAQSIIEKQVGIPLYPVHRLDRGTSGVLLFSKVRELNHALQSQFADRSTEKTYYCLLRGAWNGKAVIDSPLKAESGVEQEAMTEVEELFQNTLPIAGRDGLPRKFTFVRAKPITGRYHQIRRHLARLGLPIANDNRHGDRKLNRELEAILGSERMYLRCIELGLKHPKSNERITIRTHWTRDWHAAFDHLGFCPI